ncbi:GNAT family protein [uncultured Tenacibaculum sp.]|uniref:GNAT family N-acetyltransferase n=1 Tax=uncultured Tenacibaculum sp. TaxID=174713 RepID=UPI0026070327|nr:GNAT family protein [uncultured Tenacibaculum sp.]
MVIANGNTIILRDWIQDDFVLYKNWHDSKFEWTKLNGPYYPLKSAEELDQEIQLLKVNSKTKKRFVIANKATNTLIGTVSWYWQSEETNWISIGLAIFDEHYWGKGIGYEALSLWVDYLFSIFSEIVRLDLRTWSGNTGMIKLSEKLGFQKEATFRKARIVNGNYYDSLAYGVLREEWKNV